MNIRRHDPSHFRDKTDCSLENEKPGQYEQRLSNAAEYQSVDCDITSQKQAELELIKSRDMLLMISRMGRIGGWEKNLLTGDDNWSEVTREIHEVPPDFVPDMQSAINFYKQGESRDTIIKAVKRAMETGEPYDLELQIVTARGNERWVRTVGNAEFKEGRCTRLHGTFQDITDYKLVEKELKEKNMLLGAILDNVPDMVNVKRPDFDVVLYNQAWMDFYKKSVNKGHVSKCFELFKRETPCEQCPAMEAIRTKTQVSIERFSPELGVYLDIKAKPVLNDDGRVEYVVEQIQDITRRKKEEDLFKFLSFHDPLTGVYNRNYFENELLRLSKGRDYPISIIAMDVDGMKIVNDVLGHDRGDELLKNSARVVQEIMRETDILARTGGDEFTVLLPGTEHETGLKIVGRIRENIKIYNQKSRGNQVSLGISIGLSCAGDAGTDMHSVLKEADDLMYRDKLSKEVSARSRIMSFILTTLETGNYSARERTKRIEKICQRFGEKFGLSEKQLSNLVFLAQVHNLGYVVIPDHILLKQEALNVEEWKIIRQHPEKGYRIAQANPDLAEIADLVLKHHERYDGLGYPEGLSGEDIPVECRILSIVDAFEAMTSGRPHQEAIPLAKAMQELEKCAGSQFDPQLVNIFLELIPEENQL
jgi:diguanylate cyclase (GGDEF)-like protein